MKVTVHVVGCDQPFKSPLEKDAAASRIVGVTLNRAVKHTKSVKENKSRSCGQRQ